MTSWKPQRLKRCGGTQRWNAGSSRSTLTRHSCGTAGSSTTTTAPSRPGRGMKSPNPDSRSGSNPNSHTSPRKNISTSASNTTHALRQSNGTWNPLPTTKEARGQPTSAHPPESSLISRKRVATSRTNSPSKASAA